MSKIDIEVRCGGYPAWCVITDGDREITIDHKQLLELEHAVALAKRKCLMALPHSLWHEVDPTLAGK